MSDLDALERRYRRLMLSYPRRYRRERSGEIIDTLLQGTVDGQVRPTRRDAWALVLGGLRARAAVDGTPGVAPNVRLALRLGLILCLAQAALIRIDVFSSPQDPALTGWDRTEPLVYGLLCALAAVLIWCNQRVAAVLVATAIAGVSFYIYNPGSAYSESDLVYPRGSLHYHPIFLFLPVVVAVTMLAISFTRTVDRPMPRVWLWLVAAMLASQNFPTFIEIPTWLWTGDILLHVAMPVAPMAVAFAWIIVDARPAIGVALYTAVTLLVNQLIPWNGYPVPWPAYTVVIVALLGVLAVASGLRLRRQARV